MNFFKKLPSEIEDIIWNLYWMDVFKLNVIKHFNKIKMLVKDLNDNINFSNVIKFTNENKKLEYLNKYNMIILELSKDKGTSKFSLLFDKNLVYAFNNNDYSYMQYKNLKPITNYLVAKSGIMRYSAYHVIHN